MQIFKYAKQSLLIMGLVCSIGCSLVIAETKLSNEEMRQIIGNVPQSNKKCSGGFYCPVASGSCEAQGFICLPGTCTDENIGCQVGVWTCVDATTCCNIERREVLVPFCKEECKWLFYNSCVCEGVPSGGCFGWYTDDCTAS